MNENEKIKINYFDGNNLKSVGVSAVAGGVILSQLVAPSAHAAFSVATDIVTPSTTITTLADNTASAIAPVALGLTAIAAFGYVMKRFLFSA